ncbi:MAG: hypothetical protein COV71_03325 [Candidatus Omnitrophica bacterium CG11_big_fil_rev_8_21_14_0_20_41_12]|nr:MAG: hypothetical protein COV71_03325 [Candidatus Omnitrophica bacterium CG11_big_fil_rev_8_21_14_0_20_41_12]
MRNFVIKIPLNKFKRIIFLVCFFNALVLSSGLIFAEEAKESPIIINGDNVEYSADSREVSATGNIEVTYKGSKLTCNKLRVNMQTRDGVAEGNARLQDAKGVVTGEKIIYNFADKKGVILDADFRANPYFGKAKKVEKVSDSEFIARRGYFTTCSLDQPHYRFEAKKLNMFPGDKTQAKEATLYLGAVPVAYLPKFNYSMKEPLMHVQVEPGTRKDWGPYLLSAWRYNITSNVDGRFLLDYRNKLGWAEGFYTNYRTPGVGKGEFKFYYTQEKPADQPKGMPTEFQRYFMRWRHKWDIDQRTNFVSEFFKITDERRKLDSSYPANHNFLQDYFFREYEKDSQPLSYALFHHAFNYSSLDILLQMRTNHWFNQIEKLPELNYSLPSLQLWETPFYFENITQLGNYNKKGSMMPVPTNDDVTVARLDTKNTISQPMKIAFIQFRPFVSSRQTFYDKGANDQTGIIRTIFSGGADMSTKFYRIFDVKSNFLNMDINGLRHIITPTVAYLYTHVPTIPGTNIKQIDSVDSINRGNTFSLGLSNKLQTKREGKSIDFVDFLVTTEYVVDPKNGDNAFLTNTNKKFVSQLSDVLFKLKVLPYSWLRLEGDATYEHSDRDNVNYNRFSLANYDLTLDLGKDRSFGVGQRYERKGKNEVTLDLRWRLSPKWKFGMYQRYNFKKTDLFDLGSQEQEYTLTRDLHCWELDITLNKKEISGTSIFFTFRLKAFPENEFGFDQSLTEKKSGAQ